MGNEQSRKEKQARLCESANRELIGYINCEAQDLVLTQLPIKNDSPSPIRVSLLPSDTDPGLVGTVKTYIDIYTQFWISSYIFTISTTGSWKKHEIQTYEFSLPGPADKVFRQVVQYIRSRKNETKTVVDFITQCGDVNSAMRYIVSKNRIDIMERCVEWGATDFNGAMLLAAFNGYIVIVQQCKEWGATDFNGAMEYAAYGGHLQIMIQCKEWGVINFNVAMQHAAYGGHIRIMKRCNEWGATHFNAAMRCAAYSGHIELIQLCKQWGATDFDGAMQRAACGGHIDIMRLCREWGATDFNGAMENAANKGNIRIVQLCKEWGATNFYKVMVQIGYMHIKIRALLRGWLGYDEVHTDLFRYHHKRRYYQKIRTDVLPIAWHPDRVYDWCLTKEERNKWKYVI